MEDDFILPYNQIIFKSKIGEGAFGEVYKAEYLKTEVAVKKIISSKEFDQNLIKEFKLEAKLMKRIPLHPNVVLFRGITINPTLCMILEYCEEGSLISLLKSSKSISDSQKKEFALDIAKGMVIYFI